ncbi:MAG: FAD-dependent oxidoreductase [Thiogranum sp.]|nr:FAD-dependent oxidoreductase [Thiogranum sp.]
MNTLTRRRFMQWMGSGALTAISTRAALAQTGSGGKSGKHIVVVGGGFGGATCAKYLRRYDSTLEVTLIEKKPEFITCPASNWVLGGLRGMDKITHSYDKLQSRYGIKVVHDKVTAVDPAARKITLKDGAPIEYDRLVMSPGIDFQWNAIEGYDKAVSETIPHAYKAGPQTVLLRKQLEAMKDGGTVIISAPGNPFRCPPGPYERASMIAYYLKQHKPKSKVIILDTKDKFSKQGLFMEGWEKLYPGMIEWVAGSEGGKVEGVDVKGMTLVTQSGLVKHKGDVINIIPPQKAGWIAQESGLTNDQGWCPVNQKTFESTLHKDVYVIGDSSIAGAMPKSGHSANNQGKMCAAAIVTSLYDLPLPEPSHVNTCYSLLSDDYGITVAAVYHLKDDTIAGVEGAGGVSPSDAPAMTRKREAVYAGGWYDSITADSFG